MRLFGFRLPFFVAVIWVAIGSTVWALGFNRGRVETVYLGPTTTSFTVPTSYVVTTSWVEPTSYVIPTTYATAYVTDPIAVVQPAYLTTAYVRTGLFGRRRLVERPVLSSYASAYLPTSYFVPSAYYSARTYRPTVLTDPVLWPSSYIASADCICPDRLALAASTPRAPSGATTASRTGTGTRSVQSEPADESAMTSNVEPVPGASANAASRETVQNNAQNVSPTNESASSPPPVPRPPGDQPAQTTETPAPVKSATTPEKSATATTTNPVTPPGGAVGRQTIPPPTGTGTLPNQSNPTVTNPVTPPSAPPVPAGGLDALGPPDSSPPGEVRREAQRPPFSTRPLRAGTRNILLGLVQSRADGQPEEGVRIRITNAMDQGRDKSTLTDAFGRFAMHLTEGEWTVHVTMPSGRIYPVSEIRVSNGTITDSLGRRVPSLEIMR